MKVKIVTKRFGERFYGTVWKYLRKEFREFNESTVYVIYGDDGRGYEKEFTLEQRDFMFIV